MALAKNSMEGKAESYLKRIETLLDEKKAKCKEISEDIKEIYIEAKDNAVPVKALKLLVKDRETERKRRESAAKLDIDEAAAYETLIEALGELGMAAARAAGHAEHPNATEFLDSVAADDKRDFRPSNLRNTKPEDLEKLGRVA